MWQITDKSIQVVTGSHPFGACGRWSAFADLLAVALMRVSAEADTWHEVPKKGDFNRLNRW